MDGCAAHSAGSRAGCISPAFRQESLSPPPLAADPGARGSRHLRPRAGENLLRHDQVPRPYELPGPAIAVEVARLCRRPRAQRLEVPILDHELLAVLLEIEAHSRHRQSRAQLERIVDDRVEIEELDRLQRAPDLLPAAAVLGRVEHVDERSLQRGHANESAGMTLLQETAGRTPRSPQPCRQQYSDELRASELEGPQTMPREVGEPARDRVGG